MVINFNLKSIDSIVLQLYLLSFNTNNGKSFSKTDLVYLAYLYLYGYKDGKDKALTDGLTLNKQSWANKMMYFRKLGIVTKANQLHPKIKLTDSSFEYTLKVNTNEG